MEIVKDEIHFIDDDALRVIHQELADLKEEIEDFYDLVQPCRKIVSMEYLRILDKIDTISKEIREGNGHE